MTSGTGACSLTATWAADSNYNGATASQSTTASKIAPAVTFTGAPASAAYQSGFTVASTTNASTTALIASSGACSNTGASVTMTSGTGTCSLTATWAADSNYSAATATLLTAAQKLMPAITWPAPAALAYGTALSATQLNATASTAGSFAYTPLAGTLLNVGTQTLSVTFTPSDAVDYAIATDSVSLSVVNSGVVAVILRDSTGNPLAGGTVQYYSGSWKPFGTTDATGRTSMNLPAGTYSFSMSYAGATIQVSQNVGTNPLVSFQTTKATVLLKNSSGNPLDTGTVQYYATTWQPFGSGSTSGGQMTMELLPTSYTFAMTYAGGRVQLTQNVSTAATAVFQTGAVHSLTLTCVSYYAGSWLPFIDMMQMLPGTYTFRFGGGFPDTSYTIQAGAVNTIH
jgi:hypothetical protein